jgi:hypothetical protein
MVATGRQPEPQAARIPDEVEIQVRETPDRGV